MLRPNLVARRVDIVLAAGTPSVFPAVKAAGTTPVVFVATFDPVAVGLVPSLARPGGIVTGMTTISSDLIAKRLQLAKEFFPTLRKIAILVREANEPPPVIWRNCSLRQQVLASNCKS